MSVLKVATATTLGVVLSAYCLVENRELIFDEYTVKSSKIPKNFVGKKILHLSDLHKKKYGDGFNNLLNSCQFCKPDYIFFTGDLFSRTEKDLSYKIVLMKRLLKIAPVYYIMGNHETDAPEKSDSLNYILEQEGVQILRNSHQRVYCGDEFINIYGTELSIDYYEGEKRNYTNIKPVTVEVLNDLIGESNKNQCNILLSHLPFAFEAYANWGADITFSGHCHGGAIRLPLVGGVLSPERRFFPEYSKGVYNLGDSTLVVSAGLGKFRINNPSQIICVTLSH